APTLLVRFQGWFQIRLATDPDTTDEPRGVSGYTFALPGEPDLDRTLRFQLDGTHLRDGSTMVTTSTFGVKVHEVALRGQAASDHPLLGLPVNVPPGAKFHMRNYVLTNGEAGTECIDPFGLAFGDPSAPMLARNDVLYPPQPSLGLEDVPLGWLRRRGGKFQPAPGVFQQVTHFDDPVAYRAARLVALRELRAAAHEAGNEVATAGYDRRIEQFLAYGPDDRRTMALTFSEHRSFALNGDDVVADAAQLGATVDASVPWPMELTQAVWDADLLCGWATGQLSVPLLD
ncbi:MAG: hypothetical protein HKN41_03835, partial [Ilumatobacter sp.]|nr:hypothetical protein [Ilumatobacter sp.]